VIKLDPRDAIIASIAVFLIAIVMPIGLSQIYSANTTGWDPAVKTIFTVLFPVLSIIGLVLHFLPRKE